jgi:hypothetical protein
VRLAFHSIKQRKAHFDSELATRLFLVDSLPFLSTFGSQDVVLSPMVANSDVGATPNEFMDMMVHFLAAGKIPPVAG